jgi:peptidyl-prolyl cis-trans isomerase SurA
MKKKWLLSLSLLLLLFLVAACGSDDESAEGNNEGSDSSEASVEQPEMPEPDLEDVPDVVAEVNGETVSKEEFEATYLSQFQQVMMQAQMSGQEVDQDQLKRQIADGLIGQKLIVQEAENNGFEASDDAVNETLDELVQQSGLESQDDLFTALEEQGMSEDEFRTQVETQVKIDQLLASEAGDVEPTEEELQERYDTFTAQMEQMSEASDEEVEIPSFEEMESELIAQVQTEKESEAYQTLVEELQADADITNHL